MNNITKQTANSNIKVTSNELTPHQKEVFDNVTSLIEARVKNILKTENINDYMLSLTGAAGTGKTYLTAQIAKYFREKEDTGFSFTITAPTHKAVSVISEMLRQNKIQASCKTIHYFLGIKPFRDFDKGIETFKVDKTKKTHDSTSILIVDESSMIGSELFGYIQEAIEEQRVNFVFFIGDPFQLLPVDNSENQIYKLNNQFKLLEVVRQAKDSYIIKIATELRKRIQTKDFIHLRQFFSEHYQEELTFFNNHKDFIEDFHKNKEWYKENKIIATYKNKDVDSFNQLLRTKFWEQNGVFNPPTFLQGDTIRFREAYGINDISLYYNGQIVELQSAISLYHETLNINYWECRDLGSLDQQVFRVLEPTSINVFNDKLKSIVTMAKKSQHPNKKALWKTFYAVRDMFADVQYIHSSTIHKLQGSTHDVAYIDLFSLSDNRYMSDEEKYRLTYVSITRASQDIKIFMPAFEIGKKKTLVNVASELHDIDEILKRLDL
ncbi:AAA family ATPase [Sulfurimonas sp.]|uniref:ATP-dependent DNA helicase n=1 Tax=Sulfurimonas sp. TaxID=2022749 RepID=UPI0025E77B41|nr:AAA family ATPase [Sulfurimonas sp.]